jgi:hypothetical protein
MYIFFAWFWPDSHNIIVKHQQILYFCNFMSSPNLHFIFLVLTTKIHLVLCYVVQFSDFLICGNRFPSLSGIANGSGLKIHTTSWLMHSCKLLTCTMWLHYGQSWMRGCPCLCGPSGSLVGPALIFLRLSITQCKWHVSLMSCKCSKNDHCNTASVFL